MVSQCTKFELSRFTRYEAMNGGAKCRKWGGFGWLVKSPQRLKLETSNFVHGSAMRSLILVMSECSLSGRGQGHVKNLYIVDLRKFRHSKSSVDR